MDEETSNFLEYAIDYIDALEYDGENRTREMADKARAWLDAQPARVWVPVERVRCDDGCGNVVWQHPDGTLTFQPVRGPAIAFLLPDNTRLCEIRENAGTGGGGEGGS